jgi:hypothetical protein
MRSLITAFAINTANWTMLSLKATQLQHAIVLADIFHNDKFYALVQVKQFGFRQLQNVMDLRRKSTLPGTRRSWDAWGRPLPISYPDTHVIIYACFWGWYSCGRGASDGMPLDYSKQLQLILWMEVIAWRPGSSLPHLLNWQRSLKALLS